MNITEFGGALKMARSFSQMHRKDGTQALVLSLQLTQTQVRLNNIHWGKLCCLFSPSFWDQVHVSGTVSYPKAKTPNSDLDVRD